jgi:hypothetical protein
LQGPQLRRGSSRDRGPGDLLDRGEKFHRARSIADAQGDDRQLCYLRDVKNARLVAAP